MSLRTHYTLRVTRPTSTTPRRFACLALAGAIVFMVTGCSKPLLSPTDQRSPFDRYDAVRNQYATQQIEDKFGARKPNLRARLQPKQ